MLLFQTYRKFARVQICKKAKKLPYCPLPRFNSCIHFASFALCFIYLSMHSFILESFESNLGTLCPLIPKYFCVNFLRIRTFSFITKIKWSKSGNLMFVRFYFLIHNLYSNIVSCLNNVLYSFFFFLVQDPIQNLALLLSISFWSLLNCSSSIFIFQTLTFLKQRGQLFYRS